MLRRIFGPKGENQHSDDVCHRIQKRVQCFSTSEESKGPSGSIESRKLFDRLSVSQRRKKDLAPSGL
jgi:hypothetical protein